MSAEDINYFFNSNSAPDNSSIDVKEVSNITKDKALISSFETILFKDKNGVPLGAVNSCQRCRKLKKKCTKHKPKCLNCFKTNYECIYIEKTKSGGISTTTSGTKYVNKMAANATIINDTISHVGGLGDLSRLFKDKNTRARISSKLQEALDNERKKTMASDGPPSAHGSQTFISGAFNNTQNSVAGDDSSFVALETGSDSQILSPPTTQQPSLQTTGHLREEHNNSTYNTFNSNKNTHNDVRFRHHYPLPSNTNRPGSVFGTPLQAPTAQLQPQLRQAPFGHNVPALAPGRHIAGGSAVVSSTSTTQNAPPSIYRYPYGEIISNAFPPSYIVFQEKTKQSLVDDFPPDSPKEAGGAPASNGEHQSFPGLQNNISFVESSNVIPDVIDPELQNMLQS